VALSGFQFCFAAIRTALQIFFSFYFRNQIQMHCTCFGLSFFYGGLKVTWGKVSLEPFMGFSQGIFRINHRRELENSLIKGERLKKLLNVFSSMLLGW
jgi:hypothetical protein